MSSAINWEVCTRKQSWNI